MTFTARIQLLALVFLLSAHSLSAQSLETSAKRFYAFGTWVEVSLVTQNQREAAEHFSYLQARLEKAHRRWHAWRPGHLQKVNEQLRSGLLFTVDDETRKLVTLSQQIYQQSNGLFNPAMGALFKHWGFHSDQPAMVSPLPSEELTAIRQNPPNMTHIEILGAAIRGTNSRIHLDFGGIAKGFVVDQLIEYLKQQNVSRALINAGGDIGAFRHDNQTWSIGIFDPRPSKQAMIGVTLESNESVASSGTYARYHEVAGEKIHHIIDPRRLRPSKSALAVTVIHEQTAIADAAATALVLAGDRWQEVAKKMDINKVLVIKNNHKLEMSEAMSQRVKIMDSEKKRGF